MPSISVAVDREQVARSFREWQAEQASLDAQLAESLSALEAYQAHLDRWQQDLGREREELRQLREAIERDQATENRREQVDRLNRELDDAREKISSLTTSLEALQRERPAGQEPDQSQELEPPASSDTTPVGAAAKDDAQVELPRRASPVLGSVWEQFGKLREQRSLNRSNNKSR